MTAGDRRLAAGRAPAARIDRDRPFGFTFDGRDYRGYAGDTLASALIANGVGLVGRSFKYHRPRGIFSAGAEEPNAIVQIGEGARSTPNLRATQVELREGLVAASVNCWPGPRLDARAVLGAASRIMPAGFYYKTFMWPKGLFKTYETVIRHAAGLGRAPDGPDPDIYDKMHLHCDVLVVGGGPAGLAAALAAARTGARVVLADEQNELGGALLGDRDQIDGAPALKWVAKAAAGLAKADEARILTRTTAIGHYDHNYVALLERRGDHLPDPSTGARERLWKVRAGQVIVAAGAIERPLVFADNDRPGVMLAAAARAYVNRYAVRPGDEAVLFANNDGAHRTALDLDDAGVTIAAVVDLRAEPGGSWAAEIVRRGIELIAGSAVVAVEGGRRVRAVEVMDLDAEGGAVTGEPRRIACDLLAVSGGWNPVVHLHCHSGGRLDYDETQGCFVPGATPLASRAVGAAAGAFALADCLAGGFAAGAEAAKDAGFRRKGRAPKAPTADSPAETAPRHVWLIPSRAPAGRGGKQFVDLQEDVTAADIALAAREGYSAVEHLKRYTTLGMGPDQGKTSNVAGLGILAAATGRTIPEVGTTTFRPPYTPVSYGALAGRDIGPLADPVRRTPIHHWHEAAGAAFEDVGQWKRPRYYPRPGEGMREAVNRECLAARSGVGILDASTLGKIDIQGRDAVDLLDRVYTNAWSKLAVGRCRYGLMLGEDGMVMDDGVTTRLGEHHYLMTTTTGNAARVLGWLEELLQTEWPDLDVYLNSVTEHWATVTICGPNARRLLAEFTADIDLGADAFPFMSMREGAVAGIPARVYRISFTGELSFEINVPAGYGLSLWNALMTAGETYGITPYGTEAMHVLRAEKGFVIVGQETDGTMTPHDLGMDWIVSKKKKDFIGKRSLARSDCLREDRKQLVGLLTEDPNVVLPEGAQIVAEVEPEPPMAMIGHVTSSYYSANVGRSIALAVVKGGRGRKGETVCLPLIGETVRAVVADPVFYDPEGSRVHG